MKRAKTNVKPKNEWFFVDRLYRWLPIFLLLFSFANVYFVVKYVNTERTDFEAIRDRALLSASNSYVFVETTITNEIQQVRLALSNEVRRVRMQNDLRLRPLYSPPSNVNDSVSVDLPVVEKPVRDLSVTGRYFKVGGRPYLDIDGQYFSVGSDFGYGVVDAIYPVGVVCNGSFFPFVNKKEIVSNGFP